MGHACYALGQGNVVIIQEFADDVALMFFKGILLEDRVSILENRTTAVSISLPTRTATARLDKCVGDRQSLQRSTTRTPRWEAMWDR